MRSTLILPVAAIMTLAAVSPPHAWGQAAGEAQTPSLGDLARAARAVHAQEKKPAPVYTNANLPHAGDLSVVGSEPSAAPEAPEAESTPKPADQTAELEKQWRARFADARARLGADSHDLDASQRELNLAQMQYYSNPNQSLYQQVSRADINGLNERVAQLQAAVASDENALTELGEELRQAGLPEAWGRP